jgi:hypothetical protein
MSLGLAVDRVLVVAGGTSAVAMGTLLATRPPHPIALFLIPAFLLVVLRHRFQPVLMSPTWIVTMILTGIGVAGYLLYDVLAGIGGGGTKGIITPTIATATISLFAMTVTCLVLGASCAVLLGPPTLGHARFHFRPGDQYPRWALYVVCFAPLAMTIFGGTDIPSLWERTYYLNRIGGSSFATLGGALALAGVAMAGYLWRSGGRVGKSLPLFVTGLYGALFFAQASRRLALLPLCFAAGAVVAFSGRQRRYPMLLSAAILAAIMLPIPTYLRNQDLHGLKPYIEALPGYFSANINPLTVLNNILISFPITGLTAFDTPSIPIGHILVQLNPLPGAMVGWYDISSTMGLNRATPFSGIGEMGNVGSGMVIAVWLCVGFIIGALDGQVERALRAGQQIIAVAILGCCGLFAITVTQYNFRSAQRPLVYAILICVLAAAWRANRQQRDATVSIL